MDGEVVILDGVAYQQGGEGQCRVVEPGEKVGAGFPKLQPSASPAFLLGRLPASSSSAPSGPWRSTPALACPQTPFMTVTRWRPDRSVAVPLRGPLSHADLLAQLERHFPSPNIFYAVRLAGRFDWVKARSVRKQEVDRRVCVVGWALRGALRWVLHPRVALQEGAPGAGTHFPSARASPSLLPVCPPQAAAGSGQGAGCV